MGLEGRGVTQEHADIGIWLNIAYQQKKQSSLVQQKKEKRFLTLLQQ